MDTEEQLKIWNTKCSACGRVTPHAEDTVPDSQSATIEKFMTRYERRTPRVVATLDLSVLPLLPSVLPLTTTDKSGSRTHYHSTTTHPKLHSAHSVVKPTTAFQSCNLTPQVVSSSSTTPFRGTTTTTEALP